MKDIIYVIKIFLDELNTNHMSKSIINKLTKINLFRFIHMLYHKYHVYTMKLSPSNYDSISIIKKPYYVNNDDNSISGDSDDSDDYDNEYNEDIAEYKDESVFSKIKSNIDNENIIYTDYLYPIKTAYVKNKNVADKNNYPWEYGKYIYVYLYYYLIYLSNVNNNFEDVDQTGMCYKNNVFDNNNNNFYVNYTVKNTFHYEVLLNFQLYNFNNKMDIYDEMNNVDKYKYFNTDILEKNKKFMNVVNFSDSFSLYKVTNLDYKFYNNTHIIELIIICFNNLIDKYNNNISNDKNYVYNNLNFINIIFILFLIKNKQLVEYGYLKKLSPILKKSIHISMDSIEKNKYTTQSNEIKMLDI